VVISWRKSSSKGVVYEKYVCFFVFLFFCILALSFCFYGCDNSATNNSATNNGATNNGTFVAVTSITNLPTSGGIGNITLTGTVNPSNATNKTINWSVKAAGTTGASINGNILNTTTPGTVTITATVVNGATPTINFTQDFVITIPPQNLETIIYILGASGGKAAYWRNGINPQELPGGITSSSVSIGGTFRAPNGDIFVLGSIDGRAAYWKNWGVAQELTGGTSARAGVATPNGDIYIIGQNDTGPGIFRAVYWKNFGLAQELSGGVVTNANDIAIISNSIYVVGRSGTNTNPQASY